MVEGGTLLRCYTSKRGIEGSNPSSSAPGDQRLQEQRGDRAKDRERSRPLLHQHSQNTLFATTNSASVIVDLYSQQLEVVVAFAVPPELARPHGAFVSADIRDGVYRPLRIHRPRTPVNKGQEEGPEQLRTGPILGLAASFADGREAATDGSPRKDRGRPYRCWQ